MNILWIYNMPLIPEAGGTERITSLVAKGLTGRGHKCLGILEFREESDEMIYNGEHVENLYEFLNRNAVDVVINQIGYAKWLLEAFLARGGAEWHRAGGEIVTCLHFDPKPLSDFYYFRTLQSKGMRDYMNLTKSLLFYPAYKRRADRKAGGVFTWLYDHSDYFVLLSETHFAYFKQVTQLPEYDKLRAINNPLTFDEIAAPESLSQKRQTVLVCSRMDEYYKRLSLVLKAWRKLQESGVNRDWQLLMVGEGRDKARYEEYCRRHGLQNVVFTGRQDPHQYYRDASIFLLSSIGEGWGLTLTESLQNGVVPVVMNTCPVYSDIIKDNFDGYLTKDGLDSFIRCVRLLMNDDERLKKMQRNALESAKRFTLESTMAKWEEIIPSQKLEKINLNR